jgi:hypothetical protein
MKSCESKGGSRSCVSQELGAGRDLELPPPPSYKFRTKAQEEEVTCQFGRTVRTGFKVD